MKQKHTAGQWLMNTTKKFMAEPYLSKGLTITSDKGIVIAFVDHALVDKHVDEYVANAKLIVAAPDLLNALQLIMNFCAIIPKDTFTNVGANDFQALLNNGAAAIKKATL